jgi:YVTN family beta-propeller protein
VATDATTHTIYVANNYGGTISVIDGGTNTVTATIPVGFSPYDVGVNPTTNLIYVANTGSNTVPVTAD